MNKISVLLENSMLKKLFCKHDYFVKSIDVSDVPKDPMKSFIQEILVFKKCRKCDHINYKLKPLGIFWR